jgi:hypothetical protein
MIDKILASPNPGWKTLRLPPSGVLRDGSALLSLVIRLPLSRSEMSKFPKAIKRLLHKLAVALLYVWLISFGGRTIHQGLRDQVDRNDRRDLCIFQVGLRFKQKN